MSDGVDGSRVLEVWNRWDAPHYLDIVVFGYRVVDDGTLIGPNGYRSVYPGDLPLYIVFYPLFPWLTAAVNAVINEPVVSAFVDTGFFISIPDRSLLGDLIRRAQGESVAGATDGGDSRR